MCTFKVFSQYPRVYSKSLYICIFCTPLYCRFSGSTSTSLRYHHPRSFVRYAEHVACKTKPLHEVQARCAVQQQKYQSVMIVMKPEYIRCYWCDETTRGRIVTAILNWEFLFKKLGRSGRDRYAAKGMKLFHCDKFNTEPNIDSLMSRVLCNELVREDIRRILLNKDLRRITWK